ncbi:putative bifunctional diguanylate cyclase/phosphodiesterase [Halobacillus sp. B23F22_1]|uniref:putative bifunctional diguanylate cyclase/phosphodiesterase n=1 Tax=Halobacillus sp. B23F22_1 TaxID=3459514 RepID=UPI00373EE224
MKEFKLLAENNCLYQELVKFSTAPSYQETLKRYHELVKEYVQEILYLRKELQTTEQLRADFSRTMDALVNLVFKVKYDETLEEYCYVMFEGKLAHDIGLTSDVVKGRSLGELFGTEQALFYKSQYKKAFQGQTLSYKHCYNNRYFHTTLSPVKEKEKITEIIGSTVEITLYEKAETKIKYMVDHDPLTNLPNRRKLHAGLEQMIDIPSASPHITLMYCDIDRFKYINDALGHAAGDQVLQIIAQRLQSCLRDHMYLYRLSGDEYMILVTDDVQDLDLLQLGEKVLDNIRQPITISGKEIFVTLSIGVASTSYHADTSQTLIAHADMSNHYCKVHGGYRILAYTEEMNESYNQLFSLESALRKALLRNELSLHYQPKVDVTTGYINGLEALVRWKHPEKGWISPGEFIPLSEEIGLIAQIDEWVLYEACRQNKKWLDRGFAPERVAVNISASEIQQHHFTEKVERVLRETELPAKFLEIEVTESSVMQNTEKCMKTMQSLKVLGVTLSMDDFGTGYSSLSYLRQFPLHYLKIDQTFIRSVRTNPSDAEIVKAIIQLADAFKLGVIAEGVECEGVLTFLKENQCETYQGYYYSKPLPPEKVEKLLSIKTEYRL